MGKQFVLCTQIPKPKELGQGVLSIGRDGDAHFFADDGGCDSPILAEMIRAKIDFAGADGLMITGMQPSGFERDGRRRYFYQEWWLKYVD